MGRPPKAKPSLETALLEATGQLQEPEVKEPVLGNLTRLAFSTIRKGGKYYNITIKYDPDTGETSEAVMEEADSFARVIEKFKLDVAKAGLLLPQER